MACNGTEHERPLNKSANDGSLLVSTGKYATTLFTLCALCLEPGAGGGREDAARGAPALPAPRVPRAPVSRTAQ